MQDEEELATFVTFKAIHLRLLLQPPPLTNRRPPQQHQYILAAVVLGISPCPNPWVRAQNWPKNSKNLSRLKRDEKRLNNKFRSHCSPHRRPTLVHEELAVVRCLMNLKMQYGDEFHVIAVCISKSWMYKASRVAETSTMLTPLRHEELSTYLTW